MSLLLIANSDMLSGCRVHFFIFFIVDIHNRLCYKGGMIKKMAKEEQRKLEMNILVSMNLRQMKAETRIKIEEKYK